jgi:hypothetical protein
MFRPLRMCVQLPEEYLLSWEKNLPYRSKPLFIVAQARHSDVARAFILISHDESRPGKVNDDEGRETRAFGGAGVSPAVLRTFSTMQTCRRNAGATKSALGSLETSAFSVGRGAVKCR